MNRVLIYRMDIDRAQKNSETGQWVQITCFSGNTSGDQFAQKILRIPYAVFLNLATQVRTGNVPAMQEIQLERYVMDEEQK